MKRTQKVYLVVRADGNVRVTKRPPRLALDEVAVAITLTFPAGWGTVTQSIDIQVPEPPVAVVPEPVEVSS